jgi:hypothetical protein
LVVEAAAIEATARKAMLTSELARNPSSNPSSCWRHGPDVVPVEAATGTTANAGVEFLHRTKPHVTASTCGYGLSISLVLQTSNAA